MFHKKLGFYSFNWTTSLIAYSSNKSARILLGEKGPEGAKQMQAQVYEGYVDVPAQATTNASSRMEWLNRLEAAVALSADEELPDWPFERSKAMRPPLDLTD